MDPEALRRHIESELKLPAERQTFVAAGSDGSRAYYTDEPGFSSGLKGSLEALIE
jgi:hypothetical protein